PNMDGVEFAKKIKILKPLDESKLILLSSVDKDHLKIKTNKTMFSSVLLKPIKNSFLKNAIGEALHFAQNEEKQPAKEQILDDFLAEKYPLRILIAEDNMVNQVLLLNVLKKMGYHADVANNGQEVVTASELKYYDIMLLDIQMPVMDGLEATTNVIKQYPEESERPIIVAMTANAMPGTKEECLGTGMNDYMSKPFTLEGIQSMLIKWANVIQNRKGTGQEVRKRS
ncbi:MAG: response regulator, partial [Bacteroidia bacterium]|nr:response regulator [Bacteroidia bacterium]